MLRRLYSFVVVISMTSLQRISVHVNMAVAVVLLLLLHASISAEASDAATEPLYFMFMASNSSVFNTTGTAPAVDMALERINGDSSLLSGYSLRYPMLLDSMCSRTKSLDVFFDELRSDEPTQYVAVVGCGCSLATEPVAEISHYYNMPTISYASSAELLSNRERFRSYFRTDPSEEHLSPGLAEVVRYYGWRQVAMLTQEESLFLDTQATVKTLLSAEGINVTTREFATRQNPLTVDDLFVEGEDTRVFILNMYSLHARTILCQASQNGFTSPRYTWITLGWYAKGWWRWDTEGSGSTPCSDEEMMTTLERGLAMLQYPVLNETLNTASNTSSEQFLRDYEARAVRDGHDPTVTAPLAYDAVWVLAIALEGVSRRVALRDDTGCEGASGELVPLGNFTYDNEKLWCLLHSELQETDLLGVSGHIHFDEQGSRVENSVRVEQYRVDDAGESLTREVVAHLTITVEGTLLVYSENESNSTVWPAGIPPDGIPIIRITTKATALSILYYILAIMGIFFALACLGFNILFRGRKIIRLTSPNLNYLIIAGTILLFISVVFLVIPSTDQQVVTIYCNLDLWLFSVGNTLCFSVVLAKMWRVYYIFSNPSPKAKPTPPKDRHLLLIVTALVGADVLILLVPTCLENARLNAVLTDDAEHSTTRDENGVRVMYYFYYCHSHVATVVWIIVSFAYKLILQVVAIYFAFKTRKVKIKPLNDSKEIAAIIYITSLILVASVGAAFALGHLYLNAFAAVLGGGRLVIASIILALIFIPKMKRLWHDPNGDNIFVNTGPNSWEHSSSGGSGTVANLEKRITELQSKLKAYETPEKQHSLVMPSACVIPLTNASATTDSSVDYTDEQKSPNGIQ